MSAVVGIDLSQLPAPQAIEVIDSEAIIAALVADFTQRYPDAAQVINLESEPARKLLEVVALRETFLRAKINAKTKSLLVAYASGGDLDQIGVTYYNGSTRLVITPADPNAVPPIEQVLESDDDYRRRLLLQPEGESVAGPAGSYVSHALDAHPDIADASAYSPWPAGVVVSLLGRAALTPSAAATTAVAVLFGASDVLASASTAIPAATDLPNVQLNTSSALRPVADRVIVRPASIVNYTINADITVPTGPDSGAVADLIRQNLRAYLDQPRRLGRDIARSAIYAALHVAGVSLVTLTQPAADVVIGMDSASNCTGTTLKINGEAFTL